MGKPSYEQKEKSGGKKIILVISFIILIGILGFLIYEVKFAKKNVFDNGNKYEEYDPNYRLEDNSNKQDEQSNVNESNVNSNIDINGSNVTSNTDKNKSNVNNIKITGIKLNASKFSMVVGDTKQLKATIVPSNAPNKGVTWTSSNPKVATIDRNGKVVAKTKGSTVITVTTADRTVSTKTTINVVNKKIPVTKLAIKYSYASKQSNGVPIVYTYNTTNLSAIVTPSNATDKSIKWTSSNPKVATVNSNGKVTAVASGETVITATSTNNVKTTQKILIRENPYVFKVHCTFASSGPQGYTAHCRTGVYDLYGYGKKISYSSIKTKSKTYTYAQLSTEGRDYLEFRSLKTVILTKDGQSHVIPVKYTN